MKKTTTWTLTVATLLTVLSMTACKNKPSANPFFEEWENAYEIPPFDRITVAHYREAFLKGMEEQSTEIDAIVNNADAPSFENTIVALDASGQLLNKVSGVFFAESSSNATEEILALESEIIPLLTQHGDKIRMNTRLFEKVKQVKADTDSAAVSPEDYRLLHETYLDFVRNGVNLPEDKALELKKINEELARLENKFGQNVLNETGSFQLVIENKDDLSGLSDGLIASAADRAEKAGLGKGKWVFGLDKPSILPFLASADNRKLRNQLLTAYLNRCNNDNKYDNKDNLKNIVIRRNTKAKLLGYANFAEYILERRMAKNSKNVYDLLDKIWWPGLNKAKEELTEMQALIGQGSDTLTASDWSYYAEKIKQEKYDLSEDTLRPYFQAENVVAGLFWVTNQLYDVTFTERTDLPKPNSDVRTFVCIDRDEKTELGVLFIDLYARPGLKTVGAWCGAYRDTYQDAGKRVLPLTYVCCNFPPPVGDTPSLLTSDDAETFFHEMGHAMNNLFQNVKYRTTGQVPSDFVELPSQFMEHWVFEPQVLAQYAKHYKTGEIIPQDLVDKIQASSKYGQGFATTEYLAASYLDLDYHVNSSPETIDVLSFEANTLSRRGLIPQIPPRYRSTYFKHTFEGGYASGYYSYIWSEALDCDAFEAFVEAGNIFDKDIADRFRRHILEPGGIYPADELYLKFRGRQPDVNALLRNRGLN